MQPKQGRFENVVVRSGHSELFQGAVNGARVDADGGLTVQGALSGPVGVSGVLMAQGSINSDIAVAAGGVAILQGVVLGLIRNEGVVVLDVHPDASEVSVENSGAGRSASIEDVPPELRRMLPTMTTEQR